MKIIRDNKIYVQAKDIAILSESNLDIPQPVVVEIFNDYSHQKGSRLKNLERYIAFSSEEAIKFFKNQDWIIDIDEVNRLNSSECLSLLHKILDDKRDIFTSLEEVSGEKAEEALLDRCKFLDHKESQLKSATIQRVGNELVDLPEQLQPTKLSQKVSKFMKKIGSKK